MSSLPDPSTLSEAELERRLAELDEEERSISRRRRAMHDRIDFLRGGGGSGEAGSDEQLESLLQRERAVSDERNRLHETISILRTELQSRHRPF